MPAPNWLGPMAIEVFSGTSIPRELTTAAMEYLWVKWKTLHDTNDLTLQRLTEESDFPLQANLTHMVSTGDDFLYVYVGKAIREASQEQLVGLGEVDPQPGPVATERVHAVWRRSGTCDEFVGVAWQDIPVSSARPARRPGRGTEGALADRERARQRVPRRGEHRRLGDDRGGANAGDGVVHHRG